MVGRASVVFAIQNWLGESQEAKKSSSQPAYFSVGMSSELLGPFCWLRGNANPGLLVMALVVVGLSTQRFQNHPLTTCTDISPDVLTSPAYSWPRYWHRSTGASGNTIVILIGL
jgi:hypothetical protein